MLQKSKCSNLNLFLYYKIVPSKEEKQLELQSTNHRSLQRGNRSKNRSSSLNKQSSQENFLVNNQSDSSYNTLGLKACMFKLYNKIFF